jgi:hypothetical protein
VRPPFTSWSAHSAVGYRRVTAITEITGMEQDTITMQDIYCSIAPGCRRHKVAGTFRATGQAQMCRAWSVLVDAAGNV